MMDRLLFVGYSHTGSRSLHQNHVNDLKWNANGNWLLSASADRTVKLFDLRIMKEIRRFDTSAEVNCADAYLELCVMSGVCPLILTSFFFFWRRRGVESST